MNELEGPVLVTGASGFIGSRLVRRLIADGARVHGTSRSDRAPVAGLRWHTIDLGHHQAVDRLIDSVRPKVIFHLASQVVGARQREQVRPTFFANLASTVFLLDAITRTNCCRRFVQVGSLEEPDPGEPLTPPSSPYAAAKASASAYGRMFHQLYGAPVVLARLFMVYGPAQQDLRKLVPYVILSLLQGKEPQLSSGSRPVDWIYVDDVVEGLIRLGTTPGVEGQRVDLGSGRLVTVGGVVEQLYRRLAPGAPLPFGSLPDRPLEQVRRAEITQTARQLGWRPTTSLERGLEKTIAWYQRELAAGRLDLPD